MQHSAIYYDGQASKPNRAQVEVFGNSLSIYYDEKKVIWVISEIQYAEFSGKDKTMLKYGAFPHQYLEYHNEGSLSQNLQGYLPKPDNSFGVVAREYNALIKVTLIGISVFLAIGAIIYFVLLPNLASYISGKIPVSTEITLGDKLYESFISNTEIDTEKTKLLNDFARKIDFETKYPLKFTVANNKEVNAFALPGGNVVVFSGIIEKIKSSEELAALLSHEVTHIKERHSLKGLLRGLTGSLLISVIFGDTGSISNLLVNQVDNIHQLGFSRSMEKQADIKGLQIMYHNRIHPEGMLYLMKRLENEEKKQSDKQTWSYLNSHPMTEERIRYIKENIENKIAANNKGLDGIWKRIQSLTDNKY